MRNLLIKTCEVKKAKMREALMKRIKDGTSTIKVEGDDTYKQKVYDSLETLAETDTGLALLLGNEQHGKGVTIKMTEPGKGNTENANNFSDGLYDYDNDKPGPGTGSTVNFDPDRTKAGNKPWSERDPAVGLGHELIHSYHDGNGTTDGRKNAAGKRSLPYKGKDGKMHAAPGYEQQTVGLGEYENEPLTENNIRDEMGETERDYY